MDHPQAEVQLLLERLVAENKERGLQVVAWHRGKKIVDAWAGWTDASRKTPVDGDTLFPVFSISKGITSTLIHRLVERGILDYNSRIAHYWPEFGQNGKDSITLRQVLEHSAGLPHMPVHIRAQDLPDWKRMCGALAELAPSWPPGSRVEYHAITYGWLVGETACRATGLDFPALLEREIKEPLGLRDMYIGHLPDSIGPIAVLEEIGPPQDFPPDSQPSAIPWWTQPLYAMLNLPEMQRACVPSTSGLMSARSIARHYASLAPGGVDGVELLPPGRVKTASAPRRLPDGTISPFALGYTLGGDNAARGNRNSVFGHGGHGGFESFYDQDLDLAFAFTRNRLRDPNNTPTALLAATAIRNHLPA